LEFNGKPQEAILVRPISPPVEKTARPRNERARGIEMDDEIPF
jgi:hypothetical protein